MDREERIAEVVAAWQEARDRGEYVDPASLFEAHPDLARDLRIRFAALGVVEQAYAEARFVGGETPHRIGEYEILREVGRGGMGVVYEAVQTSMNRRVALKVLFPAVTGSPRAVKRFQREAQAAGRLQHTNIVPVYALGREASTWYYAMELVEGSSLAALLKAMRKLGDHPGSEHLSLLSGHAGTPASGTADHDPEPSERDISTAEGFATGPAYYRRVARLFADVADALDAAHEEGVIHRDVKPSNLILDEHGRLKLLDFGLARMVDGSEAMTVTGELLGTPVYMSPEQARARLDEIDHRTDVYSLGATLYESLTLGPPFRTREFAKVYQQILTADPETPRSRNDEVPRDLETIVLKAMEKERDRRYATAGAMARDLRAFADGLTIGARRTGILEKAWRKAKRHKVRTGLVAALLLAAVSATFLAIGQARAEKERRAVQYEYLLRQATDALHKDFSATLTVLETDSAAKLYTEAIELDPKQADAYVGRVLALSRSLDERLADTDAAVRYGLDETTGHWLRAFVYAQAKAFEKGEIEADLAGDVPDVAPPLTVLFAGMYRSRVGEAEAALTLFDRVIWSVDPQSVLVLWARRQRLQALSQLGRWQDCIDDLLVLRADGDRGIWTTVHLASSYRRAGQPEKGRALIDEVLARKDYAPVVYATLAERFIYLSSYDWSRRVVEHGLGLHPEDGMLRGIRGYLVNLEERHEEAIPDLDYGVEHRPDAAILHAWRASTLSDLGRFDEALAAAEKAVDLDPGDAWIRVHHAAVLRMMERYEQALEVIDQALALDPHFSTALRARGGVLLEMERFEDARAHLEELCRVYPTDALAAWELAKVFTAQARHEEALPWYRKAGALDPRNWRFPLDEAHALFQLRRFEEAEKAERRVLALAPDHTGAMHSLGVVLIQLGRADEALEVYEKLAELEPDRENVWSEIGYIRMERKDWEGALSAYREEQKRHPDNHFAAINIPRILGFLGRDEEALEQMDALLERNPSDSFTLYNRGDLYQKLGRFEEAAADYARVAELRPTEPGPLVLQAFMMKHLGRKDEVRRLAKEIAKRSRGTVTDLWDLAVVYTWVRDHEASLELVQQVLALDPAYPRAWSLLGECLQQTGEPERAIEAFRKARELDPGSYVDRANLAAAYQMLGREAEAADVFSECLADFSDQVEPKAWLALILSSAVDESIRAPARAVRLGREARAAKPRWWLGVLALSAALYRDDRHQEALATLEEGEGLGDQEPMASFIAALALKKLGRDDEARARFEKGAERLANGPDGNGPHYTIQLLHDEAKALLEGE